MKKWLALLLSGFLCLSVLAGCSNSKPSAKVGGSLSFYYWDDAQKGIMNQIIAGYNKQYPNVKVNSTIIPYSQYWIKLQTALPAGTGPDIFWMNGPSAPDYVQKGLIANLTDLIKKDNINLNNFTQSVVKLYTFNKKIYAIPKDKDTIGLFYNKALFDKAGLAYPDDTWNWDSLLSNAEKLTNSGNYGFVASDAENSGFGNFIYQAGGSFYGSDRKTATVNTAQVEKAIRFLVDTMYKYKVSPTAAEQQENSGESLFEAGKVAMLPDGCWMAATFYKSLGKDLGVASLPKDEKSASIAHGIGFVMNAKSKNLDTAWSFLKYCSTKKAQELQTSAVIPAYIGAETSWENSIPGLDLKIFVDALNTYSVPYPVAATNSSEVDTAFNNEIGNIWFQSKTVNRGLTDAENEMTKAFQQ
jgi:ABC-type sugar transport system, periplasmic component